MWTSSEFRVYISKKRQAGQESPRGTLGQRAYSGRAVLGNDEAKLADQVRQVGILPQPARDSTSRREEQVVSTQHFISL